MHDAALVVQGVDVYYGLAHVVQSATLRVDRECVALMGRNGAGKTSLVRALMGITPPRASGAVRLGGHALERLPSHARARLGVGYVPQGRRLFPSLTVLEHLTLAARAGPGPGDWSVDKVFELFPSLAPRRAAYGDQISGGERSMLAIGRALMGNPACLVLDEPTEGLAPAVVDRVAQGLHRLAASGMSVLLVEQSLRPVLQAASRVLFMHAGRIVEESTPAALQAAPELLERMLGLVAAEG